MPYTPRTPPYAHQQRALDLSWDREQFALLMEMGTGKTKVALDTIGMLADARAVRGAVVVAPKGVYMNWVNKEVPQHLPPEVGAWTFAWSGGRTARQRNQLEMLLDRSHPRFPILVMNTEALSTGDRAMGLVEQFLRGRDCIMVVDESTTIKSPSASRTKAAIRLGKHARFRRILTGMPVTKSPLDVYSQFEFLRPGLLGFRSYYAFRARYALMEMKHFGPRSINVVTGYQNEADLQQRLAPHSFRVLKEDCLDLPPKVYTSRSVELTPEQRRVYDSVLEDATAKLGSGDHVTATEVITQLLRLHQVSCGHVVDENGVCHQLPENRTAEMLAAVEESRGGPMIVWSAYRADIPRIVAALRPHGPVAQYHGGTPDDERAMSVQRFTDGSARFFVGTPNTGGFGLTLTNAANVVYYSNSHSLELRSQSEDRPHRIGQRKSVTYVDLVAGGTVDEKIIASLRKKIDIASAVVGDGYRQWLV
jgi:SNF2 family DNA or RNA helicase